MHGAVSLKFEVTTLPDLLMESACSLESLPELCIEASNFGNIDVSHLRKLEKLKKITLFGLDDVDEICSIASGMVNLESFAVDYKSISSRGVSKLANCQKLTFLGLLANDTATSRVSDSDMPKLVLIANLEYLNLNGAAITDAAPVYFVSLPNLERLRLAGSSGITDESANSLSKIANLKRLDVTGTRMTEFGARQIQCFNPSCTVER